MNRFARYPLVLGVAVAIVLSTSVAALATWLIPSDGATLGTAAASLPAPAAPTPLVRAANATLTWPVGQIAPGVPVAGYRVTRYPAGQPDAEGQEAGGDCAGVVTTPPVTINTGAPPGVPVTLPATVPGTAPGGAPGAVPAIGQAVVTCTDQGLPDGAWQYTVKPVQGGWTGPASLRSIRAVVSTGTITFPLAGETYRAAGYAAGCRTPAVDDLCGAIQPVPGALVRKVGVSVRQVATGRYWDGAGFVAGDEVLVPAIPGDIWSLPFDFARFPAAGRYVVHVIGTEDGGRTSEATSSFSVA